MIWEFDHARMSRQGSENEKFMQKSSYQSTAKRKCLTLSSLNFDVINEASTAMRAHSIGRKKNM